MPRSQHPALHCDLLTRRDFLRSAALLGLTGTALSALCAEPVKRRYRVGACDWSIGKAADPSSLELAREIGLDGVQVSLGGEADDLRVRQATVQQAYVEASKKTGVAVASLGVTELNRVPFKSDPRTIQWVSDAIDVCGVFGVKVVLLAFFAKGDLRDDPAGVTEVVRRLRDLAPKAEKSGVILGIESWLSAPMHLDILDRVGSRAVQVYYDVCNSHERGYDIYSEIRQLGRERICEFHAKENGALLGQGQVDFQKVRAALEDIGYEGWIQIEGAIPKGKGILESYQANCKFMRQTFAS